MSDGTPGDAPVDGEHLDDERLSALIDGQGEPADTAHVESCEACALRLGTWREVAIRVSGLGFHRRSGVVDQRRDEAVRAAMAAAAPVRTRFWRWSAGVAAVAAVAAGVVFGVTQVNGGSRTAHRSDVASGPAAEGRSPGAGSGRGTSTAAPTAAGASAGGSASAGSTSAGSTSAGSTSAGSGAPAFVELGSLADRAALVTAVEEALPAPPGAASAGAGTPGAGTPGAGTSGAGTPGTTGSTVAPTTSTRPGSTPGGCPVPSPAAAGLPSGAVLVLEGDALFESEPAGVFVFASGSSHAVVVDSIAGCRMLLDTSF